MAAGQRIRRSCTFTTACWAACRDSRHPESYLLGRGWQLKSKGVTHRSASAIERLGPVPQNGTTTNQVLIADAVEEALSWVRRVRTEGQDWQLLPEPSVPELYPNMAVPTTM